MSVVVSTFYYHVMFWYAIYGVGQSLVIFFCAFISFCWSVVYDDGCIWVAVEEMDSRVDVSSLT